jgi:Ca2+-binding EF-hand superfamily protein
LQNIHLKIEINKKKLFKFQKKESGTVDFEEFINMMSKFRKVKSSKELEDELKEIFNVSDFFLF